MSSQDATPLSLFTTGDVVLANPKEAASLFAVVVTLSVILENVFGAFRENRSRYVKLLFLQCSEEIMIIGVIALLFVFIEQSVTSLPGRWIILFRWIQTVLFFFMFFFIVVIIWNAWAAKAFVNYFKKYDQIEFDDGGIDNELQDFVSGKLGQKTNDAETTPHRNSIDRWIPKNIHLTITQKTFFLVRAVFKQQLLNLEEYNDATRENGMKGGRSKRSRMNSVDPNRLRREKALLSVSVVDYMSHQVQQTMVKFTDITWQCWLSLIFLTSFNSIRMFVLPGKLQSKPVSEYTLEDRVSNAISYVFIIGWIPMIFYIIGAAILMRNFSKYLKNTDTLNEASNSREGNPDKLQVGKTKVAGSTVWLPPKQLTAQLMGQAFDDPSVYLLRGNRTFTLHILKIPVLMLELYFAMFIVGQWGQISTQFGVKQLFILPLALFPVIIVWFILLPIGIVVVGILTSLGTRLDENFVHRLAFDREEENRSVAALGLTMDRDEPDDELAASDALALTEERKQKDTRLGSEVAERLQRLEATLMARERLASTMSVNPDQVVDVQALQREVNTLRSRVKFLEELCASYGIPIVGSNGELTAGTAGMGTKEPVDVGAPGNSATLIHIVQSLSRLQDQVREIGENRSIGSGPTTSTVIGATAMVDAVTAARRIAPPTSFGIRSVRDETPAGAINTTRDIHRVSSALI